MDLWWNRSIIQIIDHHSCRIIEIQSNLSICSCLGECSQFLTRCTWLLTCPSGWNCASIDHDCVSFFVVLSRIALIRSLVVLCHQCVYRIWNFNEWILQHKWLCFLFVRKIVHPSEILSGRSIRDQIRVYQRWIGLFFVPWINMKIFGSLVKVIVGSRKLN